jgi:short subunit dehydrogenase-like uncharacterized protein
MPNEWILYGATGYTGRLIAEEAVRRKMQPILAGRDANAISKIATELRLEHRGFGLGNEAVVRESIRGAKLVLNCAGPFSATARPLIAACLAERVHYLDITGELDVIEAAAKCDEQAQQAGVIVMPAVGFDVVPSDFLAASLAAKLPSATKLTLAFSGLNSLSPGTAKTMIESLALGGRARIDGQIKRVPVAWKTREVLFREGPLPAVTIPWGDVASAYYSTGIGNIEVYAATPPQQIKLLSRLRWLFPLLKFSPLRYVIGWLIDRQLQGPSPTRRERETASLWGRVENAQGQFVEGKLTTPNGYGLTVLTALAIVERLLDGIGKTGFLTPSKAFGTGFIAEFAGCDLLLDDVKSKLA